MLKLTKTGIGLLTRQYRSVLKKCWAINVGIWNLVTNLVSNAASAVCGGMNTLRGSSKNSAKEFLELIAALQNCNFLNDETLKNMANNFIETIKLPAAELLNTLTGGTFSLFGTENENVTDVFLISRLLKQGLINPIFAGVVNGVRQFVDPLTFLLAKTRDDAFGLVKNQRYARIRSLDEVTRNALRGMTFKSLPTALVAATVMATTLVAVPNEAEAGVFCSRSTYVGYVVTYENATTCSDGTDIGVLGVGNSGNSYTSFALGTYNSASASESTALGYNNGVSAASGTAVGYANYVYRPGGTAVGYANYVYGDFGLAMGGSAIVGDATYSRGLYSTAIGYTVTATGGMALALGAGDSDTKRTTASGTRSIAIGASTSSKALTASGQDSMAIGTTATASVQDAIAIGTGATASSARYAVAIGAGASATKNAVAIGQGSQATEAGTVSVGSSSIKRKIINVAAGTADNDAVNYSQIKNLKNYTAGTGITISDAGVISADGGGSSVTLDTTFKAESTNGATSQAIANYLNNNYYRNNKKSEILNGVEAGEIGNENDDNLSQFRADNDNFAINNGDFVLKNGDFITKNLSRLGAFAKCEKACPRLSERFPASLEKNSAFEQYSRSARGTFLFVSQTHKNVLDNFYKNSQCLKASNDNFATTTFLRAI